MQFPESFVWTLCNAEVGGEISTVIMCLYQVNLYFMAFGQIDFCEAPWGVCKYESSCSVGSLFAFTGRIKRRKKSDLSADKLHRPQECGREGDEGLPTGEKIRVREMKY